VTDYQPEDMQAFGRALFGQRAPEPEPAAEPQPADPEPVADLLARAGEPTEPEPSEDQGFMAALLGGKAERQRRLVEAFHPPESTMTAQERDAHAAWLQGQHDMSPEGRAEAHQRKELDRYIATHREDED